MKLVLLLLASFSTAWSAGEGPVAGSSQAANTPFPFGKPCEEILRWARGTQYIQKRDLLASKLVARMQGDVNRCLLETHEGELVPQSEWTVANGEQGLRAGGWYEDVGRQAEIDDSLASLPDRRVLRQAWPQGIGLDPDSPPVMTIAWRQAEHQGQSAAVMRAQELRQVVSETVAAARTLGHRTPG